MVERIKQTEILLEFLENYENEEIFSSTIINFCYTTRFLPDNQADVYYLLSDFVIEEALIKIKNGNYFINKKGLENMKKDLIEWKEQD